LLVLGALIATAKSSSGTTDHDVRGFAAELIVLSETLRDYGTRQPNHAICCASSTRRRRGISGRTRARQIDIPRTVELLEHVRETIRALEPVDGSQRWLQELCTRARSC